jgi:hypothetical protein
MPALTYANSSREQIAYMPEASFGTIPGTGNCYALRNTGESLAFSLTKENDKEMNATAQLTSSTTTYGQADGDIKVHVQYAEYDRLLAGLLRSSWSAYGTNGVGTAFGITSITAGTAGVTSTVITASAAPTGSSAFSNLVPGQWIMLDLTGSSPVNNPLRNLVRVLSTNGTTTITLDLNTPLKVEGALTGAKISGSRLMNGTTLQPFTIEKQSLDINQFQTFRGMNVSKFSTSFASKALTEGTFTFLGKDMLRNVVTQLPGAPVASNTYDIQNGVKGIGQLWEGGAPITSTSIKSLSLDVDSGLRAQDAAGSLGLVGIGIGTFMVKGTLTVYFANGSLYDKFLADQYTSLIVSTQDSASNGYVLTLPRVMLTTGKVVAGSKDTDVMAVFDYVAYADMQNANAALRKTLIIDRVGDAVAP